MIGEIEVYTQGLGRKMTVDLRARCGDIKDGIGLDIEGFGSFVVPLGEFVRIAYLAVLAREGEIQRLEERLERVKTILENVLSDGEPC